jgi:hypothetical protein
MLPSRFQQIRDRTVAAVDTVFAEPIKLSFLSKGEPDSARPAVQIDAVLRVGSGKEGSFSPGTSRAWHSRLAAGKAELHIDGSRYAGPPIKKDDRVCALARRGQPWFEVLRVDDRGDTRLILELGEI